MAGIDFLADHDAAVAGSQTPIEPDSPSNEYSSTSDEDLSSTYSLTQSILNYPIENGRRYHRFREGSYAFPNDDTENERLDLQYELLKKVYGGRAHFAPLRNPKKILDIGTGTGIWPIEMSDIFPSANISGTDLSAIQPKWVPDNVHFMVDDASEQDWLYPHHHFDFIHTRVMLGAFTDFSQVIRNAFRYTKPGGWMECQEIYPTPFCDDGTMPQDWPFLDWSRTQDLAFMKLDRPLRIANKLKRWFEEAGFVDVHEEVFRVPLNAWPRDAYMKDIGRLHLLSLLDGLQGFSIAPFSRAFGWSANEVEVYLINVRKAMQDRSVHAYLKYYTVWGRKPACSTTVTSSNSTRAPSRAPLR